MRFCNGIPHDRDRIVADEHRWPAGDMRRPSAMGGGGATSSVPVLRRTAGAPSPSPWPLPLPHGERKGARGKVRARQPCAAVPGRKTLPTPPIAEGRAIHPLPANGAHRQRSGLYRLECQWRTASTIQVFDHTLRSSLFTAWYCRRLPATWWCSSGWELPTLDSSPNLGCFFGDC